MFLSDLQLLLFLKYVFFSEQSWNREHSEVAVRRCPAKKLPLKISENSQVSCNFLRKETPAQVFPCEFYEIFKGDFFTDYLGATAS